MGGLGGRISIRRLEDSGDVFSGRSDIAVTMGNEQT